MVSNIRLQTQRAILPANIGDIAVWKLSGFCLLLAASFSNLVALNSDKDEIALDGQVYLKLGILAACGLYGLIGFLTESRVQKSVFSFPVVGNLAVFGLCFAASLFAHEPANALASTISILCIYLMTMTAASNLGKTVFVKTIFWASGLFVLCSWVIYFVLPSYGVMQEPVEGGNFVARMSGLSHPNTLGQFAGMCALLGCCLFVSYRERNFFTVALVLIAIAALVNSYSRSSMVAAVISILFAYRSFFLQRQFFKYWLGLMAVAMVGITVVSTQVDFAKKLKEKTVLLSKSGDSEELTTATGRAEIWAKSLELIGERPILGYGPTSSKRLLEDYSFYTHNLWLNVGLSCGVGGMLIVIALCLIRTKMLFHLNSPVADGLFVFIMLNGIFENIIFSNLCGLPTIGWLLSLAWFEIRDGEDV